jgi:heptosyltransferase-2
MRIVVFCPNMIGDTVMATPALRALRAAFTGAVIHGVLKPSVTATLDGAPWLDDRILFDRRSTEPSQRTLWLLARLRRERYDLALLLTNTFRSAALARLAGARRRVGYDRYGRGILLTDRLQPPRAHNGRLLPTPAVEYYLGLTSAVGARAHSVRLELFTTPEDEQAADRAWADLGLPPGREVVCLNTGGAFGPAKSWPAEHFARLAQLLVDRADRDVLVLCGPAERGAAREIARRARRERIRTLADQALSLGLTKACVRRSALLVSTDSGPRHFATAFDVPVVTLFGPTHIAWTRTNHTRAIQMHKPVPCGPCQRPICPEGHHRCMRELDPVEVFAAALRLLDLDEGATWRRLAVLPEELRCPAGS